jgi:UPF0755 protein
MKKPASRKIQIIVYLILFILLLFSAAIFSFSVLLKPVSVLVDSEEVQSQRFVIPKGQAISIIGQRLQEENLIKNAYAFRFVVMRDDLASKIQAGSFDISPTMSVSEIAKHLTTGTEDVWITILEGWRAEEIAESLANKDLDAFDKEEFLNLAKASEGMLYPDTYLIPREMTSQAIYNLLLNTFEKKVSQGLWDEIEALESGEGNLSKKYSATQIKTFDQVLIMASLVEREAKTYEQMRRVAGILWNRIEIGMALQVDATLQYSNGYNKVQDKWWAVPSAQDKKINSPFNTYLNPGLPPKPICNPGLNAIKATLEPIESDALFYIHDSDGSMYYSSNLEGHNANINKYLR